MKKGLVLEGGAMRGLFSAGVMDVMMEQGITFDGVVGVSAGAAFGCNYKSKQIGRAIRYNKLFAKDRRYCSIGSLIRTGDLFNARFAYHVVPERYDLFDYKTFEENPMEFYVVCTNVVTGKAVYKKIEHGGYDTYEWIRASASMPAVSRIVKLDDLKLLDGGVADSIPLEFFQNKGYEHNIVVLTQPKGYVKEPNKLMPIMKVVLRKYPNMIETMRTRHEMYNKQLEYIQQEEAKGHTLLIYPPEKLPIGHISHNPEEMQRVYDIGRETAKEMMPRIIEFMS